MKKQNIISLLFASTILPSTIIPIASCNNNFIVDDEIKNHDENGWENAIKHIGSCKHPTIFIKGGGSFGILLLMELYAASCQYANKNGFTYTNPEYKYNDQIFLNEGGGWNYKKSFSPLGAETPVYSVLYNSDYGYSDILANSKKKSNKIDLTCGNQMMVTNLQDFDLTLDDYDTTREDYVLFELQKHETDTLFLNKIMDLYLEKDPNIKFNFVMNDYWWDKLFLIGLNSNDESTEAFRKTLTRMFKHMDKMYIHSEGGYTWDVGLFLYKRYFEEHGYTSAKNQAGILNLVRTLPFDRACQYFNYVNPFVFYNNEKYIVHLSQSVNSVYSSKALNPSKNLTKESTRKYAAPWLMFNNYQNILGADTTAFNNFKRTYLKFYNAITSSQEITLFSEFITPETVANFDGNKKNLIFLLPGAMRNTTRVDDLVWAECRRMLAKIEQNYPANQWNYIYKFHPATVNEGEIIKKLFDSTTVPANTVILKYKYPFECLVAIDQILVKEGKESVYHLIDPTTLDDEKPSGIMTGFDIFSTCFFSCMAAIANEFKIPFTKCNKLVQKDAFFITRKFNTRTYGKPDGQDWGDYNYQSIQQYYGPLSDAGEFPNPSEFEFI